MKTIKGLDRTKFFNHVRESVFGGRLTQGQVDNLNILLDALHLHGALDMHPEFAGAILATAYVECGAAMAPVREGFAKTDAEARKHVEGLYNAGRIKWLYSYEHINGNSYYGRGYVQLTHGRNYVTAGRALNLPLYEQPDLALEPRIAASILVQGSLEGWFTAHKLSDFLPGDLHHARKVVNGLDRAAFYRRIAFRFTDAVEFATVEVVDFDHYLWGIWNWLKGLIEGKKA